MKPATVRQCVVLGCSDPVASMPEPLSSCHDRPFLGWLLREFIRFGVEEFLLLGGVSSGRLRQGIAAAAANLPRPVKIVLGDHPAAVGGAGALLDARDRLDERFLLCGGDSVFDGNLARLLADAVADPPAVIGRILLCASGGALRHGAVDLDGDVVRAIHEPRAAVDAGVGLFEKRMLGQIAPAASLQRDVLPALAAGGALRGTVVSGARIDSAAPGDVARRLRRPALFLDRDGVLNVDRGWVGRREEFVWTERAIEAVRTATTRGWHVFVVTNQSGVARGLYDEAAVHELMRWVGESLRAGGGTLDDWRFCPFHPEATVARYRRDSDWRKPAPGMLLDLIRAWELDPARALMIGDAERDLRAAEAAGVRGVRFSGGDLAAFVDAALRPGAPPVARRRAPDLDPAKGREAL